MDSEAQPSNPLPPPEDSWWRRITNRFWGFDFFVSYHWASGGAYAVKLAEALRERRFDCFLDRSEFASGDDWKEQARQALANTQRLIVVGTREALSISQPVRDEVTLFTARSERVIPILFGERVPDDQRKEFPALDLISNRVVEIIEQAQNQTIGPSDEVLEQIEHSHSVLRRRRLRALLIAIALLVLGVFATGATISFINAEIQRGNAEAALIESQRELAQSLVDRGVRESRSGNRVGLLRLRRAYEIAERSAIASRANIPPDMKMSRSARRLLAGWSATVGLGLLHDEDIGETDLSPGGNLVRTMTFNIDGEPTGYRFWDAGTGRSLDIAISADDSAPDLFMSPDWTTAIHWSGSKLRRWNLSTGEKRELLPPPHEDGDRWDRPAPLHSSDGRWGVRQIDDAVDIWDLETGRSAHTIRPDFGVAGKLAFSTDGRTLIAVSKDATQFQLFDTSTGLASSAPITEDDIIASVDLSADGRLVAAVGREGGVNLFDLDRGETLASLTPEDSDARVRFSTAGQVVFVTASDESWLVDTRDGTVRALEEQAYAVERAAFSPDGSLLVTSHEGPNKNARSGPTSEVRVWDTRTAKRRFRFKRAAFASAPLMFSPDSALLLAAHEKGYTVYESMRGSVRVRLPSKGQYCGSDRSEDPDCRRAGFSADSRFVYTLSRQQRVARLLHIGIPETVVSHPANTSIVALSSNGTRLLTADREGRVQLWNLTSGKQLGEPAEAADRVRLATFSRDGAWAVTDGPDGLRTWNANTGKPEGGLAAEASRDKDFWLGLAGTLLSVEGDSGQFWDFASRTLDPRSFALPDETETFAFSRDRRLIAATSYGADVILQDVSTGTAVRRLNPRSGAVEDLQESENVEAMAFSPHSTSLLTATSYGTVRLWDIASGQLVRELIGPTDGFDSAVFSPDGEVLASTHSGDLHLWDVTTGLLLQQVSVGRAEALAFSADGRHIYVARPDATVRWRIPALPDQPARIRAWVDVLSLARWDEQGSPTPVGLSAWLQSWQSLDAAGGPFP